MTLPDRAEAAVLRATVSISVPERLLLVLAGSEIHAADVDALHAHPVSVSTVTGTSPPAGGTEAFAGETE